MATTRATPPAFIADGYTTPGFIAEEPGLHPALWIAYRPCVAAENGVIDDAIRKASPARGEMLAAECCAGHVVSWSLDDLPIEAATIVRLQPALFSKLFGIVRGSRACDVNPSDEGEQTEGVSQELQAALSGKSVEEVAAGNSPAE